MRFVRQVVFALIISLPFLAAHSAAANPQLLVDMNTGEVLYAEEAGQPWHPASLTKLMTAYVAFEAIAAGRITLDTPVKISQHALDQPPSKIGAPVDTAFRMEDALYLMLVKSANDISVAVAETIAGSEPAFVAQMNQTAQVLGMTASHFANANGLHDPDQYTSARDLAILALNIRYKYPQYDDIFQTRSVRLGKIRLDSENNLLEHFAGTTGMKTGYICASGLNIVATVERNGRRLMAIVLGATSGRERGEMAAQMFLRGLQGTGGSGQVVTSLANVNATPTDMTPYICGKQAATYVAERKAAFPMGLEGQPSYLTDTIPRTEYRVSSLGRIRNVPLPHARPAWAPAPPPMPVAVTAEAAVEDAARQVNGVSVPFPRPRPLSMMALRGSQ